MGCGALVARSITGSILGTRTSVLTVVPQDTCDCVESFDEKSNEAKATSIFSSQPVAAAELDGLRSNGVHTPAVVVAATASSWRSNPEALRCPPTRVRASPLGGLVEPLASREVQRPLSGSSTASSSSTSVVQAATVRPAIAGEAWTWAAVENGANGWSSAPGMPQATPDPPRSPSMQRSTGVTVAPQEILCNATTGSSARNGPSKTVLKPIASEDPGEQQASVSAGAKSNSPTLGSTRSVDSTLAPAESECTSTSGNIDNNDSDDTCMSECGCVAEVEAVRGQELEFMLERPFMGLETILEEDDLRIVPSNSTCNYLQSCKGASAQRRSGSGQLGPLRLPADPWGPLTAPEPLSVEMMRPALCKGNPHSQVAGQLGS